MITVPDDAYADLAEADTYHVRRNPAWALLSPDERESRLIRASDYLDSAYRFRYAKTDPAQPRQFPRKGMTDIPREVKQAVMELANNTALVSGSLTAAAVQKRQRVKVDVIEVQYAESARFGDGSCGNDPNMPQHLQGRYGGFELCDKDGNKVRVRRTRYGIEVEQEKHGRVTTLDPDTFKVVNQLIKQAP